MSILATELFRIITSADPEQVWDALTCTDQPLEYLYGMSLKSDWRPGSAVTLGFHDTYHLSGTVLVADRPHRLSYTLADNQGETDTYLTWEIIRADRPGTVIRLYLDQTDPGPDPDHELETAWLPVLSALAAHLDRCAPGAATPAPPA